jgi:hypothetical protein
MASQEDIVLGAVRVVLQAMAREDCYLSSGGDSPHQRDQKHLLYDYGLTYADVIAQVADPTTTAGADIRTRTLVFSAMLKGMIDREYRNVGAHRDAALMIWIDYFTDMKAIVDPTGVISTSGNSNQGLSARRGGMAEIVRQTLKGNFSSLQQFTGRPEVAAAVAKVIASL